MEFDIIPLWLKKSLKVICNPMMRSKASANFSTHNSHAHTISHKIIKCIPSPIFLGEKSIHIRELFYPIVILAQNYGF